MEASTIFEHPPFLTMVALVGGLPILTNRKLRDLAMVEQEKTEFNCAYFIWEFPVMEKIMSIEEALPQGFLDRGLVMSGWAY
ncbi:hypothetical protein ACS0TY_022586 [Phlomoides rotata]